MTTAVPDARPDDFVQRLFLGALRRTPLDRLVLRGLMTSIRLLSLAYGQRLTEMRASEDGLERALAGIDATTIQVYLLRQQLGLLGARLDKLPPRRRPHYTPVQRFTILQNV